MAPACALPTSKLSIRHGPRVKLVSNVEILRRCPGPGRSLRTAPDREYARGLGGDPQSRKRSGGGVQRDDEISAKTIAMRSSLRY